MRYPWSNHEVGRPAAALAAAYRAENVWWASQAIADYPIASPVNDEAVAGRVQHPVVRTRALNRSLTLVRLSYPLLALDDEFCTFLGVPRIDRLVTKRLRDFCVKYQNGSIFVFNCQVIGVHLVKP